MAGKGADMARNVQVTEYVQVQTATDSRSEAVELSRAAVEARLAACAQVAGPIASTFWWEGAVQREEEWLILLKTPADRFAELAEFLAAQHSYDEPEIIAVPIMAGSAAYLAWLRDETRAPENQVGAPDDETRAPD